MGSVNLYDLGAQRFTDFSQYYIFCESLFSLASSSGGCAYQAYHTCFPCPKLKRTSGTKSRRRPDITVSSAGRSLSKFASTSSNSARIWGSHISF